ncbi:MAG: hypothetical protein EBQ96_09845 [Proteobacteria bacterium]|nr:hypothetical protein [Pseudomonadota bacterium]
MKTEIKVSEKAGGADLQGATLSDAALVLYFVSPDYVDAAAYVAALRKAYPKATLLGCTTGGEIAGQEALLSTAVSSAVRLEKSRVEAAMSEISGQAQSYEVGCTIGRKLNKPDLKFIFILSDGLMVNGSELTRGFVETVSSDVIVSGGLAGDGARFKSTGVGLDNAPKSGVVAAVGFYGDDIQVSYGTFGGWQKFGPHRKITKAEGNVLFELDNKPALDLYKSYLGPEADKLPGSGLLFPLCIRASENDNHEIVRTIVGIDEETKSLIFAGEIPEGYVAQLMHGSVENLVDGAEHAAESALKKFTGATDDALAILVSCIGRNLLMGQAVSNEVEAVKNVFGDAAVIGFYSYGEISHHAVSGKCGLHNQTMTISLLTEK